MSDRQQLEPARRRRLDPEAREEEILNGAVSYFSEVGFDGSMRDLAQRLGVSHSLLFRYFPTKEALIDRVYDRIFLRRWNPEWDTLLSEEPASFANRLKRFYREYLEAIDRPEWVRTFIYGGLAGVNINQRYLGLIRSKVITPVALELELQTLGAKSTQPSDEAIELSWGLHGEIFYLAIRRWVYGVRITTDREQYVSLAVDTFLGGAPSALRATRRPVGRNK
jgi:AcrR family transcriptional regulator